MLLDNYLYTVSKYLPPKQREEVLKDISTNIYDYLEENYGVKDYTHDEMESAIRSMGHPLTVAESYMNEPRSLIKSKFIDSYWMIIKIIMIAVSIGLVAANIISSPSGQDGIKLFIGIISSIWNAIIGAIGMVTIIFILISKYDDTESDISSKDWKLDILLEKPIESSKVSFGETIAEIFFIILALIFVNRVVPVYTSSGAVNIVIPALNIEVLKGLGLILNIGLLSNLILNLYLVVVGKYQKLSRLISIILDGLFVYVFANLAFVKGYWNFGPILDNITQNADKVIEGIELGIKIGFSVLIVVILLDMVSHVRALVKK